MAADTVLTKHLSSLKRANRGFTLIELLIVIAILGVLAGVVIPNISKFTNSGSIAAAKAERDTLQTSVDAMMADAQQGSITPQTGWHGEAGKVTTTVGSTTYDSADYLSILPTKGTFDVTGDGKVSCTAYPILGASDITKVNG